MPLAKIIVSALAVLTYCGTVSANPVSNDEFVKQAMQYTKQFEADKAKLAAAQEYCGFLGATRREDDPKCVAAFRVTRTNMSGNLESSRVRLGAPKP